jgi:hypothetical protein
MKSIIYVVLLFVAVLGIIMLNVTGTLNIKSLNAEYYNAECRIL